MDANIAAEKDTPAPRLPDTNDITYPPNDDTNARQTYKNNLPMTHSS